MLRLLLTTLLLIVTQFAIAAQNASVTKSCPGVSVSCPTDIIPHGEAGQVSAQLTGHDSRQPVTYRWKVEGAKIVSGQGTQTVSVLQIDSPVTLSVEVTSPEFSIECDRTAACTFSVSHWTPSAQMFAEFDELNEADGRVHLDNFAKELERLPNALGYVFLYHRSGESDAMFEKRFERMREYVEVIEGTQNSRIVISVG